MYLNTTNKTHQNSAHNVMVHTQCVRTKCPTNQENSSTKASMSKIKWTQHTLFIHSFIQSFIHSFNYSFIYLFIQENTSTATENVGDLRIAYAYGKLTNMFVSEIMYYLDRFTSVYLIAWGYIEVAGLSGHGTSLDIPQWPLKYR